MAKKPKIESEEEKKARENVESIAVNIAQLGRQVSALLDGRLKRKSLLILLAHSTGLGQREIDAVLTAISNLEIDHLK